MLPSIDLRIATLIKALQQVVIPALPEHEKLAQEQARLVIGHLQMIAGQWKHAVQFESGSLDTMITFAQNLCPHITAEQSKDLKSSLAEIADTNRANLEDVNAAIVRLGTVIDGIILGGDGKIALSGQAIDAILEYGAKQSYRERVWFAANTQDPDKAELPPIPSIL